MEGPHIKCPLAQQTGWSSDNSHYQPARWNLLGPQQYNEYLSINQPIENHLLGTGADLLTAASTAGQNEPGTGAGQERD